MSVVIPHHQGLDRTPRSDEAMLEDRTFGIWRPARQAALTFILSYPEPAPEPTRLRDEHEVLSDLRQVATVGRPRRLSAAGWLVLGSLVAAAALALWGAM